MSASPISSKQEVSREEFRELLRQVYDLQRRVAALEQHEPKPTPELPSIPVPELQVSSDVAPAIGRALLTIAGAYLLRAFTELNLLPATTGAAAGILYAGFWLWRAARAKGKLAAIINTLSALIIFVPLIWEATVRLHAISTFAAAAVITVFALGATWNARVAGWTCPAAAILSLALLTATHDLLPFTIALVAIAAGAEFPAIRTRWITALCADTAVFILIILMGRAGGLPEGYAPISSRVGLGMLALLFLVFVGGAAVRTLIRGRTFTAWEIAQTAGAFALATGGVLYLTRAATPVGLFAAVAGGACYAVAVHTRVSSRNIQTYAAFGGLLVASGTFLLLSGAPLVAAWSALAAGLAWTAFGSVQSPALLWLAAAISGVAASSASLLTGSAGGPFPWREAIIILVAAAVSYLRMAQTGERWSALLTAAGFLWTAAGLAESLGAGSIALMIFAVALAWSGERWHRRELIWLMYAVMTLAGVKILLRDFSRESTMTLVVSLIFYGATLILLPRILAKTPVAGRL